MIVNIDGNINRFYAQTLCMVFFPGAKFAENEEADENTPIVDIYERTNEEGSYARATITIGEKSVTCEHTEPYNERNTKIRTEKVAVGVALFKAGEKFFKVSPSWGILTGVRPAKIARDLLNKGLTVTEMKTVLTKQYFVNPKKATLLGNIARNENKIIKSLSDNTCSLYISIPFCPSRCSYCSFVSYSTKRLLSMIPDYLAKLLVELKQTLELIRDLDQRIITIYVGGGTPSILNCEQMELLLSTINENADLSELREFTFEMGRPDTVTYDKVKLAHDMGVTRISINPQTLNDAVLETIGRAHTVEQFFNAYDIARKAGIKCINTDLIAGLPGESASSFQKSVDTILKLKPENVTYHTFCVKKAADILKEESDVYSPFNPTVGKCVDYAQVNAKNVGYVPYYMYRQKNTVGNYENVGYSLPGYEGLYNVYMMEEIHSVFACGAGAVTKLVSPDRSAIKRVFMPKYPFEYLSDKVDEEQIQKNFEGFREFYDTYFNLDEK
ncbi:MAG: coproporphyrinogen dehydrogenase HemZ [Ruminococcaceae bacterium]|nr:coproporphyrinogen dehydrogenase HemZ [Oscillospiraceae bacterium]